MSLRAWFDSLSTQCGCTSFYCTTCGGLAAVVDRSNANNQSMLAKLLDLSQLEILPEDFRCYGGYGYPQESKCSGYISCIRFIIKSLEYEDIISLVDSWLSQADGLEDYIVDGVGYYVIPDFAREKWYPILLKRSDNNRSIAETIRLKYS